ncbi:MAG: hypothetical protein ACYCZZ_01790 [Minisyncoccota bacterium]
MSVTKIFHASIAPVDKFPQEPDTQALLLNVRFHSRWQWFLSMVIAFILMEMAGGYLGFPIQGTSAGTAGLGLMLFSSKWSREFTKSFPIEKSSPWYGFDQSLLDRVGNSKDPASSWPVLTQEQLGSLNAFDRFFYRHHEAVFWSGAAILLVVTAWIWQANGLTGAFGLNNPV